MAEDRTPFTELQDYRESDLIAAQPREVVHHLLQNIWAASRENSGLRELKTLRCFFILKITNRSLDINEYVMDLEWRDNHEAMSQGGDLKTLQEGNVDVSILTGAMAAVKLGDEFKSPSGRLEINRQPVLAYGWGTDLWLGETKKLSDRAWF